MEQTGILEKYLKQAALELILGQENTCILVAAYIKYNIYITRQIEI